MIDYVVKMTWTFKGREFCTERVFREATIEDALAAAKRFYSAAVDHEVVRTLNSSK